MDRFSVQPWFTAHVGSCSCIIDHMSRRRILVAGKDHEARARKRAAEEEERWRLAACKTKPSPAAGD